jgi:uncharacterized protein YceH (UPF0502 family)
VDIWTERLERRHLPLLERWLMREDGVLTLNDLPSGADNLAEWYEKCAEMPNRLDCLASVYDTPVGVTGLHRQPGQDKTASLYLFLGEVGYNIRRTATYITIRMLDRAFSDLRQESTNVQVYSHYGWFVEVLEQMGFSRRSEQDGVIRLAVEKTVFLNRKFLF